MFNFKKIVLLFFVFIMWSCDNNSNPTGVSEKPVVKTNKFIGKWIEVFDTLADAKYTKQQKIDYWYQGDFSGWISSDTMEFNNDSVWRTDSKYWFDSSFIYTTDLIHYEGIKYDTLQLFYRFHGGDSLYTSPEDLDTISYYIPVYVRAK
jgi:hypothetical protein